MVQSSVSSVVRCHHWETQVNKEVQLDLLCLSTAWHPESMTVLVSLTWRCSHPCHGTRIHWWLRYFYMGSGISNKDGFLGDINKVNWERPQGYLVYQQTYLEVKAIQLTLELVQSVQQLRDLGVFIYARSIGKWRRKMWVEMKLSITAKDEK